MTRSALIILLVIGPASFGQSIDSVSKIRFEYRRGYYPFDEAGPYAVTEIIDFTLRNSNTFYLTGYLRLQKSYDSLRKIVTIDTISQSISPVSMTIQEAKVLWNELNTTRDNFSADFVLPYLNKPSKKEILQVAKKYNLMWLFESEYSDREDRVTAFRDLAAFYQLDSFLISEKPNPKFVMVTTDAWNSLFISFMNDHDTTLYRCNFGSLLGQPVERIKKPGNHQDNVVMNLNINNTIKKLLPKKSLVGKAVDLNSLKEEYIKWYLETED